MTACREFQGPRNKEGYGRITRDGERVYLHRWVVAQVLGWAAIKDRVVRHTCDNPPCFLYEHLIVGDHADNVADKMARGRYARGNRPRRTHCRHGHPIEETASGHRWCRTCSYTRAAERRARANADDWRRRK